MSWSILEAVGVFFDALDLLSSSTSKSHDLRYAKPQKTRSKKNKYATVCFLHYLLPYFLLPYFF